MNLKNINYSNNLSIVFSFLEMHSSVNRDIRFILKDADVTGAGFVGVVDDIIRKSGSVSFIIDGDEYSLESTIKLFGENNDRLFSRLLTSSVCLDGALIKDVIGLMSKFSDKAVILSDDKDPIIIEKLSKFHFEV